MGLTIHYSFSFKGDEDSLRAILDRVRTRCINWLGVETSEVCQLPRLHCPYDLPSEKKERPDFDDLINWLGLRVGLSMLADEFDRLPEDAPREEYPRRLSERSHVVERRGYGCGFRIEVGEGSEPMAVALGTLDGAYWQGGTFTKTQYAIHFVDAHLRVVAILDLCEAEGILLSVSDEGDYWETRDLSVLAERVNEYTSFLKGVTEAIRTGKATGFKDLTIIDSAVEQSANYMRVRKAHGNSPPRNRLTEQK